MFHIENALKSMATGVATIHNELKFKERNRRFTQLSQKLQEGQCCNGISSQGTMLEGVEHRKGKELNVQRLCLKPSVLIIMKKEDNQRTHYYNNLC